MAYKHKVNTHHKARKAKRVTRIAIVFAFFFLGILAFIGVDFVLEASDNEPIISQETRSTVKSTTVSSFRSPYFQFQASEDWALVTNESTDDTFVYIKNTGELITQKLVVYINRDVEPRERDFKITNVLPVEVNPLGSSLILGEVSDHCNESFPNDGNRTPRRIEHENVEFVCNPDSQQYNILVGELDGNEQLNVVTEEGKEIALTIVYSDLTAYPRPGDIENILTSFRVL